MPSRSRSRSRSIVAVRKNGKVTNFYKMVTTTTKAGKKTRVPRFLPRSKWPRSKSQLRALGVKESYSQIVKNNESSLRKGRAKRRSNTKKSRKSKSPRSSPKKSRSSKKRSSRKSRKSKKRSSSRGVSKSERSFRKKYYNKDSSVSGHSSHSVSSPIPTPPPRPSVSGKSSSKKYAAKFAGVDDKKVLDAIREEIDSVSGGSAQRRRNRRNRRSARKSRRSARKSRRSAKRSASRQRRSASRKSRRSARRSARKASRSASRSRRSLSRKSRRSARSASRKTRRGRKASVTGAKVSRSHKSRTGASASKKGAAWIKKKNTALKYLMRRDYGRVLSRAEFMDLPESVRTELQKQAYERAFPAVADRTPEHLLSHEGRAKRATRKEKERVAKSKSRSGRRIRKYQEPHSEARGSYPGAEQARRDMADAYGRKYAGDRTARLSAIRRDLNKTKDKLIDPYKPGAYDTWKNAPWDYDLRGIDTAESDDKFYEDLKNAPRGASVRKSRKHGKKGSHSKRSHSKRSHSKKSHSGRKSRSHRK